MKKIEKLKAIKEKIENTYSLINQNYSLSDIYAIQSAFNDLCDKGYSITYLSKVIKFYKSCREYCKVSQSQRDINAYISL